MRPEELKALNRALGGQARILTRRGEVLIATILLVDEEFGDVLYGLVSTNQPERYSGREKNSFCVPFEDIVAVEELEQAATAKSLGVKNK